MILRVRVRTRKGISELIVTFRFNAIRVFKIYSTSDLDEWDFAGKFIRCHYTWIEMKKTLMLK